MDIRSGQFSYDTIHIWNEAELKYSFVWTLTYFYTDISTYENSSLTKNSALYTLLHNVALHFLYLLLPCIYHIGCFHVLRATAIAAGFTQLEQYASSHVALYNSSKVFLTHFNKSELLWLFIFFPQGDSCCGRHHATPVTHQSLGFFRWGRRIRGSRRRSVGGREATHYRGGEQRARKTKGTANYNCNPRSTRSISFFDPHPILSYMK